MSDSVPEILDELDALWRVRFGQPLPILAEPGTIIRIMRLMEEKRLASERPDSSPSACNTPAN